MQKKDGDINIVIDIEVILISCHFQYFGPIKGQGKKYECQ